MDYQYACVIDEAGYFKDFVLVLTEPEGDGGMRECIQHYELGAGEALVQTAMPPVKGCGGAPGLVRPRWDGSSWGEGATAEEIAAWEAEHPAPVRYGPTAEEQLRADIDYLAALGGVTL